MDIQDIDAARAAASRLGVAAADAMNPVAAAILSWELPRTEPLEPPPDTTPDPVGTAMALRMEELRDAIATALHVGGGRATALGEYAVETLDRIRSADSDGATQLSRIARS